MKHYTPPRHNQHGFSLIELMVAMVVSLVLMLGIASLLLTNKESYRTENQLIGLQQNARLARFILENAVEHAGYIEDLTSSPKYAFSTGFISDDKDAGRSNYDNDSDSITIRFQSDGEINDCVGNTVGKPGDSKTTEFELFISENNVLYCIVYDNRPRPMPLINNVVLMQVQYGIDSNPNDTDYGVDQYTTTLDSDNRDQVRSVRIQLVLGSEDKVRSQPLQDDEDGFNIAGYSEEFIPGQVFAPDAANGATANALPNAAYHAYVMVDQVIALRNLLP